MRSFCRYRHHKRDKGPNNVVLLGTLFFGCIVSFVVRNGYLQKEPKYGRTANLRTKSCSDISELEDN